MSFYTVSGLTAGHPSDLNQFADGLSGRSDSGDIILYAKISPPSTAPTVSPVSTSGNLTGAYQYVVAFVTGYWQGPTGLGILHVKGNTGGGPASSVVNPNSQPVQVSNIPIGPQGVVARVIYRTKANGNTFYFLTQINDNTTTSFVDNVSDSQLGQQMPTVNTTGSRFVGDGSGLYNLPFPSIQGGIGITTSTSGNVETFNLSPATTSSLGGVQVSVSPTSGNPVAVTTVDPKYQNSVQVNTQNTFTSPQVIQYPNVWFELNDTSTGGSSWRWYGAGSSGLQFQWYNGTSWVPYFNVNSSGTITTKNNTLDDGSGNATILKNLTVNGSPVITQASVASSSSVGVVELPQSAGSPTTPVVPYRAVSVKDMTLTSTSATTILSYTPAATGQFKISGYIRVVNAPTSISVSLSFTSPSGLQSLNIVPTFTLATGDYPLPATLFEAKNGGNITLSVTSGTANNVIVSAVLEGV